MNFEFDQDPRLTIIQYNTIIWNRMHLVLKVYKFTIFCDWFECDINWKLLLQNLSLSVSLVFHIKTFPSEPASVNIQILNANEIFFLSIIDSKDSLSKTLCNGGNDEQNNWLCIRCFEIMMINIENVNFSWLEAIWQTYQKQTISNKFYIHCIGYGYQQYASIG